MEDLSVIKHSKSFFSTLYLSDISCMMELFLVLLHNCARLQTLSELLCLRNNMNSKRLFLSDLDTVLDVVNT